MADYSLRVLGAFQQKYPTLKIDARQGAVPQSDPNVYLIGTDKGMARVRYDEDSDTCHLLNPNDIFEGGVSHMSKPRFVQFDQLDTNLRPGTGALPVVLVILAVLSLLGGLVFGNLVTAVVSCALLLAVSAIVRSIRNIEAYIIYISRFKQHEMNGDSSKSYLD